MKKIELTQNKHTLVDDEDYDYLNQWKWYVVNNTNSSYAGRMNQKKLIRMHRLIMNPPDDLLIDHRDGDGLNNQKENLRICNKFQNRGNSRLNKNNSSGIKGVCWHKPTKKWRAKISIYGKYKHLGLFSDKLEAKEAYKKAAKQYFGQFYSDGIRKEDKSGL